MAIVKQPEEADCLGQSCYSINKPPQGLKDRQTSEQRITQCFLWFGFSGYPTPNLPNG
jgi:hypothetical protein